jgi:SAM-dependent methyltransferase
VACETPLPSECIDARDSFHHWFMNAFDWAARSIKGRGVIKTMRIACNVAMDLRFDWKYGTDTMRWVTQNALDTQSDNKCHSVRYQATKAGPLLQLLDKLHLPRDCTFVDIGSGKGRVLLIVSQYGFRKVVGIEFSGQLCAIARKNVELVFRKAKRLSSIEVIEADAAIHSFHSQDRVFFMYNPFDAFVLAKVLDNIRSSLERNPRSIWLIYNTPLLHDMINSAGIFKTDSCHEIGGNTFRVYSNQRH